MILYGKYLIFFVHSAAPQHDRDGRGRGAQGQVQLQAGKQARQFFNPLDCSYAKLNVYKCRTVSESHGRLEVEGGLANNAGAEATVTRFGVK